MTDVIEIGVLKNDSENEQLNVNSVDEAMKFKAFIESDDLFTVKLEKLEVQNDDQRPLLIENVEHKDEHKVTNEYDLSINDLGVRDNELNVRQNPLETLAPLMGENLEGGSIVSTLYSRKFNFGVDFEMPNPLNNPTGCFLMGGGRGERTPIDGSSQK